MQNGVKISYNNAIKPSGDNMKDNNFLNNNLLIAHRGLCSAEVPENSLLAFKEAIKNGYAIELDVRPTGDGEVVVIKDDKLCRVTGIDGYVSTSMSSALKNLVLCKTDQKICTLSEALAEINGAVPVFVHLHAPMSGQHFERKVMDTLGGYKGDYAVISCSPKMLEWFKLNAPHVKRGLVGGTIDCKQAPYGRRYRKQIYKLKGIKEAEPNFVCYNVDDAPYKALKKLKHLPLVMWNVKDLNDLDRAREMGASAIFEGFRP